MICTICRVSDSEKITVSNMNFDFDDLELRETPGGSGNMMICIDTLKHQYQIIASYSQL